MSDVQGDASGSSAPDVEVDPADVTIRRARPDEAAALAQFHIDAHPAAFLPRLGLRFMTRLYRAFIEYSEGVAFVAEHQGRLIGFSTGVTSMARFYKDFVRRHALAVGISTLPAILRPGTAREAWKTFRYPNEVPEWMPEAEYTTLAVQPWIRSKGLGGRLSDAVLDGLADLGVTHVRGTVHHTNGPMNRMMQRVGFRTVGELTLHEGHSVLYVIGVGPGGARPELDEGDGTIPPAT